MEFASDGLITIVCNVKNRELSVGQTSEEHKRKVAWAAEGATLLKTFLASEDPSAARAAAEPLLAMLHNTIARDVPIMPAKFPRREDAPRSRLFTDNALLFMCDFLGNAPGMDYKQVSYLMLGLSLNGLWRECLMPDHDAHAFARLLMRSLDMYGQKMLEKSDVCPVLDILDEWLGDPALATPGVGFESFHRDCRAQVKSRAYRAVFGSFWADFHGIEPGAFVSSQTILADRPPFQPGLVPAMDVVDLPPLPELHV